MSRRFTGSSGAVEIQCGAHFLMFGLAASQISLLMVTRHPAARVRRCNLPLCLIDPCRMRVKSIGLPVRFEEAAAVPVVIEGLEGPCGSVWIERCQECRVCPRRPHAAPQRRCNAIMPPLLASVAARRVMASSEISRVLVSAGLRRRAAVMAPPRDPQTPG